MRELDLMLSGWLQAAFDDASVEMRAEFERLLALPDPELERYLLWGVRPEEPGRAALTDAIRRVPKDYVQPGANLSGSGPV